jgi:outer membrane protein OmpA-like peptidoglycan-associated protein
MKRLSILALFLCGLLLPARDAGALEQSQVPNPSQNAVRSDKDTPLYRFTVNVVQRTTTAINYRPRSGSTAVDFRGTGLLPDARGEAKVESKRGYSEIEVEFEKLQPATRFGPEFLTYVMWAITPEGRATNLGEVILDDAAGKLNVSTELQSFALIVTAEPYFAVSQPSDVVVMENVIRKDTEGTFEHVEARYELLKRGEYSVNVPPADLKPLPREKGVSLDLLQARNAVRIAEWSGAGQHAGETMLKARQLLGQAELSRERKSDSKSISMAAREAVQTAEDARLIAAKRLDDIRIAEERRSALVAVNEAAKKAAEEKERAEREAAISAQALADEAAARARAAIAQRDAQAAEEQARQAKAAAIAEAEKARLEAAEAERARLEAAEAQERARQARLTADADVERAQMAAREALRDKAQAEDEKKRLQAQSEQERAALRAQLAEQLNRILETRDSARGLIISLSDVQFDFDKHSLRPEAREKLAKLSGILLTHPGLTLEVEGHTDDIGAADYNQRLSEQRAESVRSYLMQQGLPMGSARGFGKTRPVAPNDSEMNRQKNRRVEMIVSGEIILSPSQRVSSTR